MATFHTHARIQNIGDRRRAASVRGLPLLGARTLDGLNLAVDTRRRRLMLAGPPPAAAARGSSD